MQEVDSGRRSGEVHGHTDEFSLIAKGAEPFRRAEARLVDVADEDLGCTPAGWPVRRGA
ncbi:MULTISPECIES: hypothetical protein [unclassified Mycobacterium]|uniref:hypothetical protein n=1 Tax=unclassified Mycobacterium TaxID=2642494 RepID=UPI0012E93004|nr:MULTISPECIES: hypothetical protein [unclassified Mycobacterium]